MQTRVIEKWREAPKGDCMYEDVIRELQSIAEKLGSIGRSL